MALGVAVPGRSRPRSWLLWAAAGVASTVLGAALLWLALRQVDWGQVQSSLSQASVGYLLMAAGFMAGAMFLRGLRWRLLFQGVRVSTLRLLLVENTAIGVNSTTPIPILDEPVRVGLLALQGLSVGQVLATMAAQRIFELGTQTLLATVALVLLPPLRPLAPYVAAAAGVTVVALVALFAVGPRLQHVSWLQALPLARDFGRAVRLMRQARLSVLASFLLTIAYSVVVGMVGWAISQSLHLSMPFLAMIILTLATIFFTDWIPGLPGAVGTFEFVAISLLDLFDVSRSIAFSFAIVLHGVLFLPSILIAAVYLPYAGVRSVRALQALLRQWSSGARTAQPADPPVVMGGEKKAQ
ncbi:MAG: flippase-like domain-containing protein [Chloroflexi bacterium]|nr:flippase-like domain-containing protein [Chloroflexota bacterium]